MVPQTSDQERKVLLFPYIFCARDITEKALPIFMKHLDLIDSGYIDIIISFIKKLTF